MTFAQWVLHLIHQEETENTRCIWRVHGTCQTMFNAFWIFRFIHVLLASNNQHNSGFHCDIFMHLYNVSPVSLSLNDPFSTALRDWHCCYLFYKEGHCVLVTQLIIVKKEFELRWKTYRKNSNSGSWALEPCSELLQTCNSYPFDFRQTLHWICWEPSMCLGNQHVSACTVFPILIYLALTILGGCSSGYLRYSGKVTCMEL